jgi:arylsulfatase A-like enzyme
MKRGLGTTLSHLARGLKTGAAATVLLLALELPNIPTSAYEARPLLLGEAFFFVINEAMKYVWINVLAVMALSLLAAKAVVALSLLSKRLLEGAVFGAPVLAAYGVLAMYAPFRAYPPFVVAFLGLFGLLVLIGESLRRPPPWTAEWKRKLYLHAPVYLSLGAAAVVAVGNHTAFVGAYPTLHLSALVITHLLLCVGLWSAQLRFPFLDPSRAAMRLLSTGSLATILLAPALNATKLLEASGPVVRTYTISGQSAAAFFQFKSAHSLPRSKLSADRDALARFQKQSHLPQLPPGFELKDYNVLFISSEATRFDHTGLSKSAIAPTPNLVRMRDEGAFSFTLAYSASSGTLGSISSILGMSYPSSLPLETYKKPWHGQLHNKRAIVPQIFQEADYSTFYIGHGFRDCFRRTLLGFHHGFDNADYFIEHRQPKYPDVDKDIAKAGSARLRAAAQANERFFGWMFFVGPHAQYETHYPDMPAKTEHDRYIQEVRHMDEQLGLVWDTLKETNLLENTVVIFTGDHGEEFLEHGGTHHKASVYSEVTHVPFVIHVPGLQGKEISEPVSTYYAFPWLLSRGPTKMKAEAETRIKEDIGPMMRDTEGAVLIELLGHDRMMSSLVYDKYKFNFFYLSGLYEVFDIQKDPFEKNNLFDSSPALAEEAASRFDAYKKVRSARANYILSPDDPR